MNERILVVDDEKAIADLVGIYLTKEGFDVQIAYSGADAAKAILEQEFDLALLDVMLPDIDGFELLRTIRAGHTYPVIMLTARDAQQDKIEGLSLGADDYVVKPYRPAALLARIDRALARSGSADSARRQLERDGVLLDPVRAEVSYRSKTIELSRNELLILRILMENAGSIISRSELMDELWQTDAFVDDNTLTVNVNRLRRSLQSAGIPDDFITTRRGLGYVVR